MSKIYTEIEFFDHTINEFVRHPVSAVFYLANITNAYDKNGILYGINAGVAVPHNSQKEADEFYKKFLSKNGYGSTFYLIGQHGIKVPVAYCDSNAWDRELGTSCLFVYFTPSLLCCDNKPPHPKYVDF